jgi:hypothetical protein
MSGNRHGFLARMFLREAAFQMRLAKTRDQNLIWGRAAYSLSMALAMPTILFLCVTLANVSSIPAYLHPVTAALWVRIAEMGSVYFAVAVFIERKFAYLKNDLGDARLYAGASQNAKWWLTTAITVASGVAFVVFVGIRGREALGPM